MKKGWSELTRQLLMAVRANISTISFECLMILCFWLQIKVEQQQDALQLFSIKQVCLSVKSGLQLHFQDIGIKNLADVEVLSKDDGRGACADGGAIGGINGGILPCGRICQVDIYG